MKKGEISQQLANFIVQTTFADLPAKIVEKSKRHLLDTLAAGVAGCHADEVQKLVRMFECTEKTGEVPVWAQSKFLSPRAAAFVNAAACHAFELDDTGGCDHSGAVVIPAAFAVLPLCKGPVSGKEFITALVLGYDIARRALEACGAYEPHNEAGWHSTSTCGTFGAAAAAGKLLKLNEEEMQWALGIASSFSSGLWAFIHDGSQTKKLHPGIAAEGGVMAAMLAREGFRGPTMVFDKVWGGFSNTFSPASQDIGAWVADMGTNWKLSRVSIKPYASCRSSHAAVDAVHIIRQINGIELEAIDHILVELNPLVYGMCGSDDVSTLAKAQMSMPYAMASMLVHGNAGLFAYTEERRHSPELQAMLRKIRFQVNPAMPNDEEPTVTITTTQGHAHSLRVDVPLGAPTNPLSDTALALKYAELTGMVWNEGRAARLMADVLALETVNDMLEMEKLLSSCDHSSKWC